MVKIVLATILFVALSNGCKVIEERANGVTLDRNVNSGFVLIETFLSYTQPYLCSGVLISPKYVLTSAGCVFGANFVNVHVYAYKLRDVFEPYRGIYRVNGTTSLHFGGFDATTHINYIALIEMPDTFNPATRTFPLQIAQLPTSPLTAGTAGQTIGFGLLDFDDDHAAGWKQELQLTTISEAECSAAYPTLNWSGGAQGRACAKASATNCVSDIGSPLMRDGVVVGIQSYGQLQACDTTTAPNLIQDVFYHVDWIRSITEAA